MGVAPAHREQPLGLDCLVDWSKVDPMTVRVVPFDCIECLSAVDRRLRSVVSEWVCQPDNFTSLLELFASLGKRRDLSGYVAGTTVANQLLEGIRIVMRCVALGDCTRDMWATNTGFVVDIECHAKPALDIVDDPARTLDPV